MLNLQGFNPWWETGTVPQLLIGKKRRLLGELMKYIDLRQMQILSGIRRAGKTTLMFQVVNELLKHDVDPFNIMYFSFDEEVEDMNDIIDSYETNVLKHSIRQVERIYIFLDEVQKAKSWSDKVKQIYDMNPNIKIFISGSAAIGIKKGTRESLAGRFFDFAVDPLGFDEYLSFMDVEIDKSREGVFERQIKQHLNRFLETGGFIEILEFDAKQRERYFKEGLLERVVYRDLPDIFPIRTPELLYRLLRIIAERPGMYLDYKNIAGDLGYDQRTIGEYISYLENALLLVRIYNYSASRLTSEKKMKRAYLSSPAFSLAFSGDLDRGPLLEQFFINDLKVRFFSRTPQRDEVDIVLTKDDKVIPVEIKIRKKIGREEYKPVLKFLRKYGLNQGYVISDSTESTVTDGAFKVHTVPYWKYWTIHKLLSGEN